MIGLSFGICVLQPLDEAVTKHYSYRKKIDFRFTHFIDAVGRRHATQITIGKLKPFQNEQSIQYCCKTNFAKDEVRDRADRLVHNHINLNDLDCLGSKDGRTAA